VLRSDEKSHETTMGEVEALVVSNLARWFGELPGSSFYATPKAALRFTRTDVLFASSVACGLDRRYHDLTLAMRTPFPAAYLPNDSMVSLAAQNFGIGSRRAQLGQ
jgi:hypothetical protein